MSDFFQNGIITTLHNLSTRSQDALETELSEFAKDCPMTLVLPCLYSNWLSQRLQNCPGACRSRIS